MNNQPMNGQPPPLTPEAMAAISAQIQQSEQAIRAVVGVVLRGVIASMPQTPPQVVLSALAWQMGNQMAEALQGDLSALMILRKSFVDAFADGVQKAKLIQPPAVGTVPPNLRVGT
jgi:hypothetical protein